MKSQLVKNHHGVPISAGAALIAIGIVYGDIGTSPMYVMRSIITNNGGMASVHEDLILGACSLVIWTLTLLTTVKYVLIAMQADNKGEGGIFALYSLVKKYGKWLVIPAMIGGSALLADGMLTPAVTVTTAIEGLRSVPAVHAVLGDDQNRIIAITLVIIALLFLIQRSGTAKIGKLFGPVMMVWFGFLAAGGVFRILSMPAIFKALNPYYAIHILFSPDNRVGILILGSIFLATTGAEALYSDMGHVGKGNIYISWPFVKIALILNYLGQGAWILTNASRYSGGVFDVNPFFEMLPEEFRLFGVILGTIAAIIASQALITGSFTLVAEASRLDLMPHMKTVFPSMVKGQLYIPLVNTILWLACSGLVLFFRTSEHMEAAYGLAITLTMLMTSLLLFVYLSRMKKRPFLATVFLIFFGGLEGTFLVSSLSKFAHGGYVALFMGLVLFLIMMVWYRGTDIEKSQLVHLHITDYLDQLRALRRDEYLSPTADNLVYITKDLDDDIIDRDTMYSILNKVPKKAKAYWFVNINVTDEPFTREYTVNNFGTDFVFKIELNLGYKVPHRINVQFRQVITDLIENGELPLQNRRYSIYEDRSIGDFLFCLIYKTLVPESDVSTSDRYIIGAKYLIRQVVGTQSRMYGLENSSAIIEHVPLFVKMKYTLPLCRVPLGEDIAPEA